MPKCFRPIRSPKLDAFTLKIDEDTVRGNGILFLPVSRSVTLFALGGRVATSKKRGCNLNELSTDEGLVGSKHRKLL